MTSISSPLKNSFYARWWTSEEKRYLKKSSPDAGDEVANLRTLAGRLTRHLARLDPGEYSNEDLKRLTVLIRISVGIGTLLRGNANMQGRENSVEKSIQEAIESMQDDWSLA
jgi:hypothetical protein